VTKYLRVARIIPRDATTSSDAFSPHMDDSNKAILRSLEELSFSPVRQFSYAICLLEPRYTGDSLRNSGLLRLIAETCHISHVPSKFSISKPTAQNRSSPKCLC
jgi:hypothetical protein